jgi:hypothetical protein
MTTQQPVSDAPSSGVTYDHHSDDSKCVIYAPRVVNYTPREHIKIQVSLMTIKIFLINTGH